MASLQGCQLKVIDFNHSRMFTLDDSPIRVRRLRAFSKEDELTEQEKWQRIGELQSPAIPSSQAHRAAALSRPQPAISDKMDTAKQTG